MNTRDELIARLHEAQSLAAQLNAATAHFLIGVALLDLAEPAKVATDTTAGRKKSKPAKSRMASAPARAKA